MTHKVFEIINKKHPKLSWVQDRTIFLTLHGSRAYGTNVEGSDEDFKGVAIPPKEMFFSSYKTFEQVILDNKEDPDTVIFDIRKFLKLAAGANPNLIEVLFTDPSDHVLVTPLGQKLLDNKEIFLSKKIRATFVGYAISQMKKMKSHRGYLLNPPDHKPTREEFGLQEKPEIDKEQMSAAFAEIKKEMDRAQFNFMDHLEEAVKIQLREAMEEMLSNMKLGADDQWLGVARSIGFDDNFIELMQKERRFLAAKREFASFEEWKRTRNEKRFKDEEKFGFNCYSSDTEFLTENGFKYYDEIVSTDKLATIFIRKGYTNSASMQHRAEFLGIEYQNVIDKFDSIYNGPMYHITGTHTDCFVTSNHNILVQKEERNSNITSEWSLEEASYLPDTFNVLVAPTPKKTNYSNKSYFEDLKIPPTVYLSLMGWYLSDGYAAFRRGKLDRISIGQKHDGKLSWHMKRFHNKYNKIVNSHLYEFITKPNKFNPNFSKVKVLNIGKELSQKIVNDCSFKENKRIPRYAFTLSKVLMEALLMGLIRGDGTKREHITKDNSYIYYSKSKPFADDVQELAMMAGWETALWGPFKSSSHDYEIEMYQVHLRKIDIQTKKLIRSKNVQRINVENHRVVCFSVPNGTLVTRRNGKISFHGNCKHAYHLVRLTRMAEEMLSTGKVIVKRPDREELLFIRNGGWTYDQIMDHMQKQNAKIDELFINSSVLPDQCDFEKVDRLGIELIEQSFQTSSHQGVCTW